MRCETHDQDTTVGPCVYCDRAQISADLEKERETSSKAALVLLEQAKREAQLRADLAVARATVGVLRSACSEALVSHEGLTGEHEPPTDMTLGSVIDTLRRALAATPEAAGRYLRDVEATRILADRLAKAEAERDTWKKLADQYNREAAETTAQAIAERDEARAKVETLSRALAAEAGEQERIEREMEAERERAVAEEREAAACLAEGRYAATDELECAFSVAGRAIAASIRAGEQRGESAEEIGLREGARGGTRG